MTEVLEMTGDTIRIGGFRITETFYGDYWISVEYGPNAGEGGTFSKEKVEKMLFDFYDKEF